MVFDSAGRSKKTVSLGGGPPFTVVAGNGPLTIVTPAWGSDGMIYFGRENVIYRVPSTGGEPEAVTTSPPTGGDHRFPDVLPDGRGLLLSVWRGSAAENRIAVVGPEGGDVREILTGAMARYAASGHVVYTTADGTLMAAPLDLRRLEVTSPSVSLLDGVQVGAANAQSQFALSETGTLLYKTGAAGDYELVWVTRTGAVEPVDPAWTANLLHPALSPDGARLAVNIRGAESRDIWVKQLDRGPSLKLTFEGTRNEYPTWTPDGESVTFFSNRDGNSFDLWTKRADGSAQAVLEADREEGLAEMLWSPDGEWLVYRTSNLAGGPEDILVYRI